MEPMLIPALGLALPGHDYATPAEARTAAANWLTSHGHSDWSDWDAQLHTETARVAREWYSPARGLVQEHHDGVPVTVVHLPDNLTTPRGAS